MALTDTAVQTAKPRHREYKLADGGALFVGDGGWWEAWRLKYRAQAIERKLAMGRYPDVTLAEARKARD